MRGPFQLQQLALDHSRRGADRHAAVKRYRWLLRLGR